MQEGVLCRICLFSYDENRTRSIFTKWQPPWLTPDETDEVPTIAERIAELAQTEINKNDPYPPVVCVSCFHQFQKMCLFLHRICLSDRLMRKRTQLFHTNANQASKNDVCEDAPFTITSVLQLSDAQYDNLENINKLNDEEENTCDMLTSDDVTEECNTITTINTENKTSDKLTPTTSNAEIKASDEVTLNNAESETSDKKQLHARKAENESGIDVNTTDLTEIIQNSSYDKTVFQDNMNDIRLTVEKSNDFQIVNNDIKSSQDKGDEKAIVHGANEIEMLENQTNEIDLIQVRSDVSNETEIIHNKQIEFDAIEDGFNDNELLQEIPISKVNQIELRSISDKFESNVRSADFRNDTEMLQFLEGYNSEWIDCKDVFTSTDDFAEYLGIKVENDDYGLQVSHERLINGYHSELTLDENQIKVEPVSEDEEMLMDASRRLYDRGASPFMETEWLEDFKTEPSDSETSDNVPQECMLCSKRFQTMSGLKTHVISSHSYRTVFRMSVENNITEKDTANKDYSDSSENWCQYCNIHVSNLARHLYEVQHTFKKCSWCGSTFANDRLLFVHSQKCIRRHRNLNGRSLIQNANKSQDQMRIACIGSIASPPMDISAQYKCRYCSESFVNSEYLNIHIQAYHSPSIRDDGGDDMEALQMEVSQGSAT